LLAAYLVPAGLSWALLGAALGGLPLSDAALILIPAYALCYGVAQVRGQAFPSPPGTAWQVPSAWVLNTPRWRRTMIWGALLGPGFATRNPYAGFGFLILAVAAAGGVRRAVLLAVAIGVAHGTGRAAALLRSVREIDSASYLRSMLRSMYWRAFDGYALLAVAGLSATVCLHRFWLYIPATRSLGTERSGERDVARRAGAAVHSRGWHRDTGVGAQAACGARGPAATGQPGGLARRARRGPLG
jgi:hypothetical protein